MSSAMGLSLRSNFVWNLSGIVVYNLGQWVLLVAIANFGDREMMGQFALALAISSPVFLTVGLNLRVVRATDVRGRWSRRQYLDLRLLLNVVSVVVSVGIGIAVGLSAYQVYVLAVVCVSKAVESTSLLFYGYCQRRERLDLVARSMILRGVLGVLAFSGALALSDDLLVACAGLALGWMTVWTLHDLGVESRLRDSESELEPAAAGRSSLYSLARAAFPLGLDTGVVSVFTNTPRYGVQIALGTAALGSFAALAYLAQVVSTITGALGDAVVGPLAKRAAEGDVAAFVRLTVRLVVFATAVAGSAALIAELGSDRLMSMLLGKEYARGDVLVVLMIGVGAITIQRSLARGLQATHRFSTLLVTDALMLVTTIAATALLVDRYGMLGAAIGLLVGAVAGAVLALTMLLTAIASIEERKVL